MADLIGIGQFNKRVVFKTVTKTKDLSSGHNEVWTSIFSTWAKVVSRGGRQVFNEGKVYVFEQKDIYVNWRLGLSVVDKDTRIEYEGRDYSIQAKNFVNEQKDVIRYETVGL